MRHVIFVALVALAACSSSATPTASGLPHVAETPRSLALPGDANGIYWDATSATLYLTDDTNAQLVRWTEATGFQPVGPFPAGKVGLGGLVRLDDGTFVTTSFGFGHEGGVFTFGHEAAPVPNLDPVRRRIGLARTPDGTLYDAYFVVPSGQPGSKHEGGVARLDLAGHETELAIPGLGKPVGLAANATTLFISDQDARAVLAYALATGAVATLAKDLPGVDLLTLLPGGDLVTGGKSGAVIRIDASGHVTTIASGLEQIRGTAYDADHHRLFVVEHGANRHTLRILDVP